MQKHFHAFIKLCSLIWISSLVNIFFHDIGLWYDNVKYFLIYYVHQSGLVSFQNYIWIS